MTQPAYPAARAVAARIRAHFARHLVASSPHRGMKTAPSPDIAAIEAIIDAAFWASLRREEGYMPRISLALVGLNMLATVMTLRAPGMHWNRLPIFVWAMVTTSVLAVLAAPVLAANCERGPHVRAAATARGAAPHAACARSGAPWHSPRRLAER